METNVSVNTVSIEQGDTISSKLDVQPLQTVSRLTYCLNKPVESLCRVSVASMLLPEPDRAGRKYVDNTLIEGGLGSLI